MVVPWRDLAASADAAVDEQFAEQVRFIPMRAGTSYEAPTRDPDRQIIETVAVFRVSGDMAIGLTGDRAGSPMIERMAVGNTRLSVTAAHLGAFDPREGDRVIMLERGNDAYEINRVPPPDTGRYNLVLIEAPDT